MSDIKTERSYANLQIITFLFFEFTAFSPSKLKFEFCVFFQNHPIFPFLSLDMLYLVLWPITRSGILSSLAYHQIWYIYFLRLSLDMVYLVPQLVIRSGILSSLAYHQIWYIYISLGYHYIWYSQFLSLSLDLVYIFPQVIIRFGILGQSLDLGCLIPQLILRSWMFNSVANPQILDVYFRS